MQNHVLYFMLVDKFFIVRGEMLLEYSEDLFELFVDHIEVYSRQSIGFVLHCGLLLRREFDWTHTLWLPNQKRQSSY